MAATTTAEAPIKQAGRRWILAKWTIFVASALAAVFVIPQYVAVPPTLSPSYIFGYSNRTGVLLLVGFLILAAIFSKELQIGFSPAARPNRIAKKNLYIWMALFAAAGTVMCFVGRGLHGFEESAYLIDRVKMLAAGQRPFRDFEFAYGVLFLYGPRALMALNLTAEHSYFVFWLFCLLTAVWLLYRVIEMIDYPTQHKVEIFNLFCLMSLTAVTCTGVNYTLLRFLPAAYFGLLVQHVDKQEGRNYRALAMLMSAGCTAVILLISPEIALAYVAGSVAYFGVFGRWNRRNAVQYFGFVILDTTLLLAANRLGAFATLKTFSSGGFNLPIVPAAHILFFFFACGLVSFFVAARLRHGSRGDGTLMIVAVSAGTLAAALGRGDIGHVAFEAIGILIVATMLASNFRLWDGYRIAFVVLFVFTPSVLALVFLPTALAQRKASLIGARARTESCPVLSSSSAPLLAPFGYSPNCDAEFRSGMINPGYFYGLDNVLTPATIDIKISEMRDRPRQSLLLPNNFDPQCRFDLTVQRRLVQTLFVFPYFAEVRNEHSVAEPLCSYIHANYSKAESLGKENWDYAIWSPSGGGGR